MTFQKPLGPTFRARYLKHFKRDAVEPSVVIREFDVLE